MISISLQIFIYLFVLQVLLCFVLLTLPLCVMEEFTHVLLQLLMVAFTQEISPFWLVVSTKKINSDNNDKRVIVKLL